MIVVDSNIVCYYALPGTRTAAVDRLRARDPHWCVPPLWHSEFRNVVMGQIRRGAMDLTAAQELVAHRRDAPGERVHRRLLRGPGAKHRGSRTTPCSRGRTLTGVCSLTFDKDFGELVLKRGARASHGIVLFRIPLFLPLAMGQAVIKAVASRTDRVGRLRVVEIGRVRMRILVP